MPTIHRELAPGSIEIYYEVHGEPGSPVLVLGHSFLCSRDLWHQQVPTLAARYRVLNVDLRGHGRSAPALAPYSIWDLADDLVAVLDAESVERAVWGGLSIGGLTALRAALRHPSRVAALMILDSHAGREPVWKRWKYRAMAFGARGLGVRPFLPAILPLMFGATTRREQPELVREWRERIAAVDLRSIWNGVGALNRRESLLDRLPEIDVPTLVLVGAEDRTLWPAYSRQLVNGLPRAQLVEIAGAGHLAALERPQEVTRAMEEFLTGLDRAAA